MIKQFDQERLGVGTFLSQLLLPSQNNLVEDRTYHLNFWLEDMQLTEAECSLAAIFALNNIHRAATELAKAPPSTSAGGLPPVLGFEASYQSLFKRGHVQRR